MNFRNTLIAATAIGIAAGAASAQDTVKIGVVSHLTGPLVGGEAVTHAPAIALWLDDVNERGGLMVDGEMRLIELVQYDDKSNPTEHIKAVQRLATLDKVDFMLSPWGTGFNIAAAPIYARYDYPLIAVTAITDEGEELAERFPNMFFTAGTTTNYARGVVETLTTLRESGDIGNRVAMVNVADAFGIELAQAARQQFNEAGFELVYETSYPLGTADLSPVIKGAKAAEPDAFVAFSYPPDTFALTEQAIIEDLEVGAFYTAVATAFPAYEKRFGAAVEGNLGTGGVNLDSEAMQSFRTRLEEVTGTQPDYWATVYYYSQLQVLQQAIEGVGTLDRVAVTQYLRDNSFETAIGTIDYNDQNMNDAYWTVGQWIDGEFWAVADTNKGDSIAPVAKIDWK